MPVLQSYPGRPVVIVEQSKTHVILENRGASTAPFVVLFPSQTGVRRLLAARQFLSTFHDTSKEPK